MNIITQEIEYDSNGEDTVSPLKEPATASASIATDIGSASTARKNRMLAQTTLRRSNPRAWNSSSGVPPPPSLRRLLSFPVVTTSESTAPARGGKLIDVQVGRTDVQISAC